MTHDRGDDTGTTAVCPVYGHAEAKVIGVARMAVRSRFSLSCGRTARHRESVWREGRWEGLVSIMAVPTAANVENEKAPRLRLVPTAANVKSGAAPRLRLVPTAANVKSGAAPRLRLVPTTDNRDEEQR